MRLNPIPPSDNTKNDKLGKRQTEQNAADNAIKTARDELSGRPERLAAFMRLMDSIHGQKATLGNAAGRKVFLIGRLKHLAELQSHWIRPCETWCPETSNLRLAFRSLAHHLLALYPVPNFMDSAWDLASGPAAFLQQSWFIRLGRGASFRSLNLPLNLTRAMEHHVRQAPDHYSATQALRYGEALGLGGTEALAREIAASQVGRRIENPEFWREILRFFAAQEEMPMEHVGPIVDFIQANRFPTEVVLTGGRIETRPAIWPDFSIKGRTLKSILRLVAEGMVILPPVEAAIPFRGRNRASRDITLLKSEAMGMTLNGLSKNWWTTSRCWWKGVKCVIAFTVITHGAGEGRQQFGHCACE